jgi:hypothetical protein
MRWSADDEIRFATQVAVLLESDRDGDEILEQLVSLVEDTLLVYGVPFSPTDVPRALDGLARRLQSGPLNILAGLSPLKKHLFFAMMVGVSVRMLIDATEAALICGFRAS